MCEGSFSESAYPAPFLERFEVIECLSTSPQSETLLVMERESSAYGVAKVTQGGEPTELALLGSFSHPALPKIIAGYSQDGTHVFVREYVKGTPLDQAMAERPFSEAEVLRVGARLSDVLMYLHAQTPPVIHRDVKPGNVILGADGAVTLIDFGIARTYKPGAPKDTVFSGTNDFAPPEQYGYAQTDARADVYALGMLLRFMLTNGDLSSRIEDPRLRRIVKRCTAFAPGARYPSALAVKKALLLAQRNTARLAAMVAALLLALGAGVLVGRYAIPYHPKAPEVSFSEPVIEQAVRLMLDKPEGALTRDELAGVRELCIFQDRAMREMSEHHDALMAWFESGRAVRNGCVRTLEDLRMLPALTTLAIVDAPIRDLSPLAACPALEVVELTDLQIDDIRVFPALPKLRTLRLVGMYITDIYPLEQLEHLTTLDLTCGEMVYNPAPLARMGDFIELSVGGSANAYQHLSGKRIGWLCLSGSAMSDMEPLETVTGLWHLDLSHAAIADLRGVEAHDGINTLNLAHTQVTDLSPLLELPNLSTLVLSPDMAAHAEALSGRAGLEIIWQD